MKSTFYPLSIFILFDTHIESSTNRTRSLPVRETILNSLLNHTFPDTQLFHKFFTICPPAQLAPLGRQPATAAPLFIFCFLKPSFLPSFCWLSSAKSHCTFFYEVTEDVDFLVSFWSLCVRPFCDRVWKRELQWKQHFYTQQQLTISYQERPRESPKRDQKSIRTWGAAECLSI